jgi:hypothetical protein
LHKLGVNTRTVTHLDAISSRCGYLIEFCKNERFAEMGALFFSCPPGKLPPPLLLPPPDRFGLPFFTAMGESEGDRKQRQALVEAVIVEISEHHLSVPGGRALFKKLGRGKRGAPKGSRRFMGDGRTTTTGPKARQMDEDLSAIVEELRQTHPDAKRPWLADKIIEKWRGRFGSRQAIIQRIYRLDRQRRPAS